MKNKNAQALGSLGGKARANNLSAKHRKAIAVGAIKERWRRYKLAHPKNDKIDLDKTPA